jgi:predicted dehydrogenase
MTQERPLDRDTSSAGAAGDTTHQKRPLDRDTSSVGAAGGLLTGSPRLALIGLGWWSHVAHLPGFAECDSVRLAAVCDADADRVALVSRRFGVPGFTSVDDLIDAGLADGVVVATPHTTHYPIAMAAIGAGLHVLVEKPMTTTARNAWDLVAAADRAGVHLSVGYTYHYSSTAIRVRDLVRTGIGELVCVNADFSSDTQALFAPREHEEPVPLDRPRSASYANPHLSGGGQGQTQLTHIAGSITWSTGRQATQAYALMANRGLSVDLVNSVSFRLEGGALGAATSTGTEAHPLPPRHRIRYYGSAGMVEHDLMRAEATVYRTDGTHTTITPEPHEPPYPRRLPVRAFADLLSGRGPNYAPGADAAAAVALIEAAYESARTNQPVPVLRRSTATAERKI